MGILREKLYLHPQEQEGNYNFGPGVRLMTTRGYLEAFGPEAVPLTLESQVMIQSKHPNPDYLQVLTYRGIKFYCISDFKRGMRACDYEGVDHLYITFLLPEEY